MKLQGQVAIVTGSSRGIGSAIATELALAGAKVVVNYLQHADLAQKIVAEIGQRGGKAIAFRADVSNLDEVQLMVTEVLKLFFRVDILVNNAGINLDKTFVKMDSAMWNEVLNVNLTGAFNCCKAVVPQMITQSHGRIVSISSIVGQTGNFGQSNYAASKAALMGLTKSLAKELATKGITVNAIAPGFIDTPMLKSIPEQVKESIIKQIPMGRFGNSESVARGVLYLVSDDADYVTGQVLHINGGMFM